MPKWLLLHPVGFMAVTQVSSGGWGCSSPSPGECCMPHNGTTQVSAGYFACGDAPCWGFKPNLGVQDVMVTAAASPTPPPRATSP